MKPRATLSPALQPKPPWSLAFEAIGTTWQIKLYDDVPGEAGATLTAAIHRRIKAFDQVYSRFRTDSIVTAMATRAGTYTLPPDADALIKLYHELYVVTNGAMTPLIGQSLVEAGYDANYSLQPGQLHELPTWDETLSWQAPKLTLKQPAWLDFGAAGKGYLVDLVSEVIESAGYHRYSVDAGGDIKIHTKNNLKVGLEHPDDPTQIIGVASLSNASLCGSAGNRRAWASFHHIIDPRTLASPRHLRAVWVSAASTILADALTTALYMAPASLLKPQFEFEFCLIYDDYHRESSDGFPAKFF
ncbi:FAD:protein FMN transferase [Candidatus Saccharibacteria bacterium]|nr:FAD:protein FMN transferase [Candidatus Saccharibacteria bacterium]